MFLRFANLPITLPFCGRIMSFKASVLCAVILSALGLISLYPYFESEPLKITYPYKIPSQYQLERKNAGFYTSNQTGSMR